ncbi:MAG: hypothetical protein KIT84_06470 [Labilithrix sp.]|nr:hypothetical protein [Labilithrix sp.]MCW5810637.1 hypothetical protein [Labilithrix sp.]
MLDFVLHATTTTAATTHEDQPRPRAIHAFCRAHHAASRASSANTPAHDTANAVVASGAHSPLQRPHGARFRACTCRRRNRRAAASHRDIGDRASFAYDRGMSGRVARVLLGGAALDVVVMHACAPFGVEPGAASEVEGGAPVQEQEQEASVAPPLPKRDAGPSLSCKDHRARGNTVSGLYTLELPERFGVQVWCDMTLAGGGWTLVGRSGDSTSSSGPFGWRGKRGSLDDFTTPYSLDLAQHPVPFREILIGEATAGSFAWGENVLRAELPEGFMQTTDAGVLLTNETSVTGPCQSFDGAWMLRHAGHTRETDFFFFRDNPNLGNFGLYPHRFQLSATGCDRSSDLHGKKGMIMVR